jgi:multiple sugar transport system ATP-binding protein
VTCDLTEPLGAEILVHFSTEATGVVSSGVTADTGADAEVTLGGGDGERPGGTRLVARVSPRSRIAVGGEMELAVDTRRLYFFDPQTGQTV